jgi:hypothetical protein
MVLDDLKAANDRLFEWGPEACADGDSIKALLVEQARLGAYVAGALAAFDASGRWSESGARSTSAWLKATAGLSGKDASTQTRRGRSLRHLPRTASAWAKGEITGAHVDLMISLSSPVTEAALARDEEVLVEAARTLTHAQFVQATGYWSQRADPDGSDKSAEERRNRRDAYLVQSVDGMWFGKLTFDPISGSIVGNELHRLEQLLFEAEWSEVRARLGREPRLADLTRTPGQRRADAMVVMASRSATMPQGGQKPRPLFTVLTQYETMHDTLSELENGTVVPPSSLLPWLVHADIERAECRGDGTIAMGHRSTTVTLRVQDFEEAVSRPATRPECPETDRFFTRATRRAIEVRDRRCTHPGCDRQASRCQIDHIQPYSEGGRTTQQNGRVLCGPHNRMRVHNDKRPPPKRE